ncbi:MAG: SprT-like domain-containing protein [Acidobacteriota bacterium]
MQVQSALLFETPEQLYARVFREIRPRTPMPGFTVLYRRFANANSFIRMREGNVEVRITDVLEGAPAPIQEALAWILLGKLFRREIPAAWSDRYRRWMNRADVRRHLHLLRQSRGRKYISGPQGEHHNLDTIFEELNQRFFNGLMGRPELGWSRRISRRLLGHFDPSHNAIIISRVFDSLAVPRVALEYVMFHEMLHLCHPVEHKGARRCVHTHEFRAAEKQFPQLKEAKAVLKTL